MSKTGAQYLVVKKPLTNPPCAVMDLLRDEMDRIVTEGASQVASRSNSKPQVGNISTLLMMCAFVSGISGH